MPQAGGLYYEEHGPAQAPVLLLSSGLGGSAGYWQPNLAALSAHYRVIAYDHRGTGRSDREITGDLTVERMGADAIGLLDALDIESATVIGHALGGMIGMAAAAAHPPRIAGLVVINAWAKLDPHTARCFDTRLALLRDSGVRPFLHAQPLFLYPAAWISEHHDALMDEEEHQLAAFPGAEMMQRRIAAVRRFSALPLLPAITAPTLFVASDDDMLVPSACSDVLHAAMPASQIARMASGGHACNVTRADHFNMWLVDWLDAQRE